MFSRRKRNYRVFVIVALIIAVCVLIIALLWPDPYVPEKTDNINVNANTNTNIVKDDNDNEDIEKNEDKTSTASNNATYYIVKKSGEHISVFFVNEDGSTIKLEDTEIIYDLLPLDDQNMFEKGKVVDGQEELAALLQDFEG